MLRSRNTDRPDIPHPCVQEEHHRKDKLSGFPRWYPSREEKIANSQMRCMHRIKGEQEE
jgi:hypothetical protein